MIILGIDPGLANVGYGVIQLDVNDAGWVLRHITSDTIVTKPTDAAMRRDDLAYRCSIISKRIKDVIQVHKPVIVAIEEYRYYGAGVSSGLALATVCGMLREICRSNHIDVMEFSAREIKRAVSGDLDAPKETVASQVRLLLGMGDLVPHSEHAADALGAAIAAAFAHAPYACIDLRAVRKAS